MDRKLTFLLIGGVFWGIGVPIVEFLAPIMFTSVGGVALFFALNFVIAAISIPAFAKITGRTRHDMLVPTVIMVLAAMLMDAISLAFIRDFYPQVMEQRMYTGAGLLFAFWSFFFFALLWHRA